MGELMPDWLEDLALKAVLSSVLRHGLTMLGALLAERGWVNGDDWGTLVVKFTPSLVAFGLSLAKAARDRKKVKVALQMPAGKSEADLAKVMKVINGDT